MRYDANGEVHCCQITPPFVNSEWRSQREREGALNLNIPDAE